MTQLRVEDVRRIAQEVNNSYGLSEGDWPDCYNATNKLKKTLVRDYGVSKQNLHIERYRPPSNYIHYALVLHESVLGKETTIDVSYAQFADGTETVIDAGPYEEIGDVKVAYPSSEYILSQYGTSTGDEWYQ